MRKFTMTKSTVKGIFALCIALSIFVGSSAIAFATVCQHDFSECRRENAGYSSLELTHAYVYGKDHNGEEIYRTCEVMYHYQYCHYVCSKCDLRESINERHTHLVKLTHSVNHQ